MEKERRIVIVIAGTPGTGKTSVAKLLAERIGGIHIDVSEFAVRNRLYREYEEERDTYIIDEDRVLKALINMVKESDKSVIIDTHYPEILPRDLVDYIILLRTHPLVLEERIRRSKDWSARKIRENVMAEILGVVAINVLEKFGEDRVYEIDTSDLSVEEVADLVVDIIRGAGKTKPGVRIDWLEKLPREIIEKYGEY